VALVELRRQRYPPSVNRRRFSLPGLIIAGLSVLLGLAASAQEQPGRIRLRNEVIATAAPERMRSKASSMDEVVSGLFLIQFTNHVDLAWRHQLRGAGVQLLRYVPDDAFVARLANIRLSQIRSLAFVRWVGPYRPEHKLYEGLQQHLQGKTRAHAVPVSILL